MLVFFCALAAVIIYMYERKFFEDELLKKTELVMASVESTRSYIREILRPRMYEVLENDRFIIEAMSTSFATRVIMDRFKEKVPAFTYRRVAIDARNPDFEANELEKKMIDYFRNNPLEEEWFGTVRINDERYFMRFKPVIFTLSCLHCHGDPKAAPLSIVEKYGDKRGFLRLENEIDGVQSIGIPAELGFAEIRQVALQIFSLVVVIVLFLYLFIWLFFDRLIVRNFRDLLGLFRDSLTDEKGSRLYKIAASKDEMHELVAAGRMMATHLTDSRNRLEEYAGNLKSMVAERTEALELSQERLRRQVTVRNRELHLLNTIAELITGVIRLDDLLPALLHEALKVIPAHGAAIYLFNRDKMTLELKCDVNGKNLEPELALAGDWEGFLENSDAVEDEQLHKICGKISLTGADTDREVGIRVPLCCHNSVLGTMFFSGIELRDLDDALRELLLSIGRQIGITLESLQNITRLRLSKELLQSVFEGITDPVVLLGSGNTIRMVNSAFLKRYDLDLDKVVGRNIDALAVDESCPFHLCADQLQSGISGPSSSEIKLTDGSIFEMSFYPITPAEDDRQSIVCFARDVTEHRKVESRIQQTDRLVALGQLAAGVAHEINNPLGVILCYTDIIKGEITRGNQEGDHVAEDITVIERHARNCQRIVADLLNFSRSHNTEKQMVSANDVIKEVESMLAQQLLINNIRLSLSLTHDLPLCLLDSERIKQVIVNLLMNASQAITSGGEIKVITRKTRKSEIEIVVEDTGPGISKEIIPKIFDPFFTTKEPGEGTGLGLSVSYGIVKDHGGEIRVESEPGQGTRFIILLPCGLE